MGVYDNLIVDHILIFLLVIVLPIASLKRGEIKMEETWTSSQKSTFYFTNGIVLWIGALIVAAVWYFSSRSFAVLGFQSPDLNTYSLSITIVFILIYIFHIAKDHFTKGGIARILERWKDRSNFMPLNFKEFLPFCFIAFSAGVAEEVIFRGYLMNYILSFFSSEGMTGIILAILIPAIVFSVIHMYQGIDAVIKIFIGGLLFGAIYYYSQSLIIVMVLHFLVDVITGYFLMRAFNQAETVDRAPGS